MTTKKLLSCASVLGAALVVGPGSLEAQVGTPGGTGKAGPTGQQGGVKESPAVPETPSGSAGMATGSDDMRKLQQALKDKGLDPGPINGVMSPKTQEAVRAFQQRQGLSATGSLDVQTRTALGIGPTGSSRSGAQSPGSAGAAAGIGVEPALPRDPSVKPGEPLPPGGASPGTREPGAAGTGTNTNMSPGSGAGSAGGAGGR